MSQPDDPEDRDHWFTGRYRPVSPAGDALVAFVTAQALTAEPVVQPRQRARKAADEATWRATVEAVVSEVAWVYLSTPDLNVTYPRATGFLGSRDRYKAPAMNTQLPRIVGLLSDPACSFLTSEIAKPGTFKKREDRKQSVMGAGPALVDLLKARGLTPADFANDLGAETIVLRAEKVKGETGDDIDYPNTAETIRWRAEMKTINARLAAADLRDITLPHVGVRFLRRTFNVDFDHGGRLYGAFWQSMRGAERLAKLRIGGEEVAEIDMRSAAVRFVYAMQGHELPADQDAYAVDNPSLQGCREGLKKVLNAMLSTRAPLLRFPKDTKALFPRNATIAAVTRSLIERHQPIADTFGTGVGLRAMKQEAAVVVATLLALGERGVVALPVHDALVVRRSDLDIAKEVLSACYRSITGTEAVLKVTFAGPLI